MDSLLDDITLRTAAQEITYSYFDTKNPLQLTLSPGPDNSISLCNFQITEKLFNRTDHEMFERQDLQRTSDIYDSFHTFSYLF
jgi:hypothetical protein